MRNAFGQGMHYVGAIVVSMLLCGSASAESYRLISGDRIEVTMFGQTMPSVSVIDIDGQAKLGDLGRVSVAGLTLDEAEAAFEDSISSAGLYTNPSVQISVVEYAPVTVSGDVNQPGRFAFQPGMTVAAALGLSGGSQIKGVSRLDLERLKVEYESQVRTGNATIASWIVKAARVTAQLNSAETFALSDAELASLPNKDGVGLTDLIAAETAIFENQKARERDLLLLWDQEIDRLAEQDRLYGERIKVQEEIVATLTAELEQAQTLRDRGLQTASRLSGVEQREADARARALELEAGRIGATRALAEAQRQRTTFLSVRQEDALSDLLEIRLSLETARASYARAVAQLAAVSGGNVGSLLDDQIMSVKFTILSPRSDRTGKQDIGSDTVLLPGDTLMVTVAAESADNNG